MNGPVPAAVGDQTAGYTLVLPPGWVRIPLRSGTDAAIGRMLDRSFEGVSRDEVAAARRRLQQQLREMAAAARERNGLDLYLPTERMHGFTVAASFAVAEVAFDELASVDPALMVTTLVAEASTSQVVVVDGSPSARAEVVEPPEPGAVHEFGARRVHYVIAVPDESDRWVVVTFSTIGQGKPTDALADLLVELFDAIMTTFRWRAT